MIGGLEPVQLKQDALQQFRSWKKKKKCRHPTVHSQLINTSFRQKHVQAMWKNVYGVCVSGWAVGDENVPHLIDNWWKKLYIIWKLHVCDVESGESFQGSVGAIKMVQDPDEHTQTNTHNGTQSPNVFWWGFFSVQLEAVMSHKSKLSLKSFIFI